MDKKANLNSGATTDSSDSYWLACIAHNNQTSVTATPQVPTAVSRKPVKTPALPSGVAALNRHSNSTGRVKPKYPDTLPRNSVAHELPPAGLDIPKGDGRVFIPANITYTAIVDDGRTHHVVWSVRNMSLSGALLEMDIGQLCEGIVVGFCLRYNLNGRAMDCRLPAKVVRTQLNGLALQFGQYDTRTCYDLIGLLYSD